MTWTVLITFAVVVLASRLDALRDRHFDPERLTRWRLPILALFGTDLWHLVKWGSFYPPLILCCWMGYGAPWATRISAGLWAVTTAAAWIAWRWGAPWPSFWTKRFKGKPQAQ